MCVSTYQNHFIATLAALAAFGDRVANTGRIYRKALTL